LTNTATGALTGEEYQEFLKRLAQEDGIEEPTDEDLRRFDKGRKGKKMSNEEWQSPTDPDSRIAKMKDGTTHMAYKGEHALDLETEFVLAATVQHANTGDPDSMPTSVIAAQVNLLRAGHADGLEELVADKGYHKAQTLSQCRDWGLRTYVAEPKQTHGRRWTDKPDGYRDAVYGNRRRIRGRRGKQLQRWRSERVERSFAHVCETGGARRTWLRGLEDVSKRYVIQAAAHNLGLLMRKLFGVGKPRCLQGGLGSVLASLLAHFAHAVAVLRRMRRLAAFLDPIALRTAFVATQRRHGQILSSSALAAA